MLCDQYAKEADAAKKEKLNKMIKEVSKSIKNVLTKRYVMDVFSFAKNKLFNKQFEYTKNSIAYLLPVQGVQVIDLRTGVVRPSTKEDQFTFECPWKFVSNPSPKVARYMLDLMNGNKELVDFFQRALGYCLTGETKEKSLFIMYGGSGDNGKSKLLKILEKLLDKFYASVSKSVFIKSNEKDRHANAHTAHLMPIVGARIIAVSELSEGDVLNDGQVKNITGDDTMRLRAPNDKESVAYRPICKPLIISNHRPKFDVKDQAIVNRVKYIPFEAQFKFNPVGNQKLANPKLIEELSGELLGDIGSWMAQGAVRYYKEGLQLTGVLEKYKNDYVNDLDTVGQFLAEECETGVDYWVKASDLFNAYTAWCRDYNTKGENSRDFGLAIKKKFNPKRQTAGMTYLGLRLKPVQEDKGQEEKPVELVL